jgi:hypothetical protein
MEIESDIYIFMSGCDPAGLEAIARLVCNIRRPIRYQDPIADKIVTIHCPNVRYVCQYALYGNAYRIFKHLNNYPGTHSGMNMQLSLRRLVTGAIAAINSITESEFNFAIWSLLNNDTREQICEVMQ